jgi:hypothetical protein
LALNKGITFATFHCDGKRPVSIYLFIIIDKETEITGAD